ncbi:unnamed protein product [Enterobius vermicularis]|uniref:CC domain-containing protein n=1 Tax=Enterobius vermicularis TaxID=51028 RepID=A0A0N4VEQ6_ENTVE|nr:unnamed protein product [Enterobius vermicularis]
MVRYKIQSCINACIYYPICINGGMSVNIGCTSDVTCQIYNVSWVCVQGCCCTTPRVYTPTQLYPPVTRKASTLTKSLSSSQLSLNQNRQIYVSFEGIKWILSNDQ